MSASGTLGTREDSVISASGTLGTREDSVISASGTLRTREDSVVSGSGTLGTILENDSDSRVNGRVPMTLSLPLTTLLYFAGTVVPYCVFCVLLFFFFFCLLIVCCVYIYVPHSSSVGVETKIVCQVRLTGLLYAMCGHPSHQPTADIIIFIVA